MLKKVKGIGKLDKALALKKKKMIERFKIGAASRYNKRKKKKAA